jgi:hypothetical protein
VDCEAPGANADVFVEEGGWLWRYERRGAGGWSGRRHGRRADRGSVNGRGVVCEDVAVGAGAEDDLAGTEVADYEMVDTVCAVGVFVAEGVGFGGGREVEDQEGFGGEELLGPGRFVDVDLGAIGNDIHLRMCVSGSGRRWEIC